MKCLEPIVWLLNNFHFTALKRKGLRRSRVTETVPVHMQESSVDFNCHLTQNFSYVDHRKSLQGLS
jgi:hypothetical protein